MLPSIDMRTIELEAWVLSICDKVIAGQPLEDDRVELKSTYLQDRQDEARRIAALCNSARSSHGLWLIGIDEKARAVPGAPADPDPANWLPQLQRYWPDLAPAVEHISVPYGPAQVQAFLFDASRAPYTVKVSGGGNMDREVPVRHGTQTRSARRDDLLRIVVPAVGRPTVEIVSAQLHLKRGLKAGTSERLWLQAGLWIENVTDTIFIPNHTCQGSILFSKSGAFDFDFTLSPTSRGGIWVRHGRDPHSAPAPAGPGATILRGDGQLVVQGPGLCEVKVNVPLSETLAHGDEAELVLTFVPVGGEPTEGRRTLYLKEPTTKTSALRAWDTGPGC